MTTAYILTDCDAEFLKSIALIPADLRAELTTRYIAVNGGDALAALFVQFVGLANSVIENSRTMAELFLIENDIHPYTAEKLNLPTIFGAATGAILANSVKQKRTCQGCAYRLGTIANQSPITTIDADDAIGYGWDFMCHEKLDRDGNSTKKCAGYAQVKKCADDTEGLES